MAAHTETNAVLARRRFADDPALAAAFEGVLLSISNQVYGLQGRRHNTTLVELARGTQLSERGLLNICKTNSDPKVSTLVRIADFFDCELVITFRRRIRLGTALQ